MIIPNKFLNILSNSPANYSIVLDVITSFQPIFEDNKLFFFEEYTDHGIKHIESVLMSAEFLISDESFKNITANEITILILSIILHDLGMHIEHATFCSMLKGDYDKFIINNLDNRTWAELWDDYLSEVKRFSSNQKKNIFGKEDITFNVSNLLNKDLLTGYEKKLIGEFIRRYHSRLAHEIAFGGLIGNEVKNEFGNDKLDETYRQLSGILARSHGMEIRKTFSYLEEIAHSSWRNPHDINIIFLMVLLRISDYIQIDKNRTNKYLLKLKTFNSPISLKEHQTHLEISSISFNQPDNERIYVSCSPTTSEMYIKIKSLLEDIQKELDISWATLGEVYGFIPNHKPSIKFRRISSNLTDRSYLEKLKYIPKKVSFQVDNNLSKLLVAPLYGNNPKFGVRELLQNSIDACTELKEIYYKKDYNQFIPKVIVSIKRIDDKFSLFEIKDNGKGMSKSEIINYFLNVGTSFRKSVFWKKEFIDDQGKTRINRNGKFGIGVLASFLLGDEIEVKTKYYSENFTYQFVAKIDTEFIEVKRNKNTQDFGTEISIKIDEDIRDILLEKTKMNWTNWFIYDEPLIEFYVDDKLLEVKRQYDVDSFYSFATEEFEKIKWKYFYEKNSYGKSYTNLLACNGIIITKDLNSSKTYFDYPDDEKYVYTYFRGHVVTQKPSIIVTDKEGIFPLKLDRNDIDTNYFPFDDKLLSEVSKKYIIDILSLDLTINKMQDDDFPHNSTLIYSSNGYTLNFDYFLDNIKESYGYIKLITGQNIIEKDLSKFKNCLFYPVFNERINLTYQERNVAPTSGGRILLKRKDYDNLYRGSKKRLAKSITNNQIIESENNNYVIFNLFSFNKNPEILKNVEELDYGLIEGLESIQEIPRDFFSMKGGSILNELLKYYIKDNCIIPYDIQERKKIYKQAFKDLSKFLD
jgi:molecular chaperone HtpG